jgi:phosphoglycerate kinase
VNLKSASTAYVVGGAKVEDYLPIFSNLKNRKNKILASGVLANLLLVAKGADLGYESEWLKEKGYFALLPKLKTLSKKYSKQIILPVDAAIDSNGSRKELDMSQFPQDAKIWDVGHKTVELFKQHLSTSKAIFMKGPLGFSETQNFSYATVEILQEVSSLTKNRKAFSLLGGGHLTTTAEKHNIPDNFSHVSMSGGALIAYISGQKLPGLEALK